MDEIGWWTLDITGIRELTDDDREHIAGMIREGCVQGQLVHQDEQ